MQYLQTLFSNHRTLPRFRFLIKQIPVLTYTFPCHAIWKDRLLRKIKHSRSPKQAYRMFPGIGAMQVIYLKRGLATWEYIFTHILTYLLEGKLHFH